jgi:hypothetical protein
MTDETQTETDVSEQQATVPATEAEIIANAVEAALNTERSSSARTPAQKDAAAYGIYVAWRNANLGGLTPKDFSIVEAASTSLISAIAAQL